MQMLEDRRTQLTTTAEGPGRAGNPHFRLGLALVVLGGLALAATSAGVAAVESRAPVFSPGRPPAAPAAAGIAVRDGVYRPGETSGWHRHPGLHVVTVLTGVLTVYDGECIAHTYGPGETYIGGHEPHLARNEGTDETRMVITSVSDTGGMNPQTIPAPLPDGCQQF